MAGITPSGATSGACELPVVLEASGQDLKVVHILWMKPCYPTATELQEQELKRFLEIFQEDEEDEEVFLGFSRMKVENHSVVNKPDTVSDPKPSTPLSIQDTIL